MATHTLYLPQEIVGVATISDRTELLASAADPHWYDYSAVRENSGELVAEFDAALLRLEELVYAVFGSVPDYEDGVEWYNRDNPRCLWLDQASTWEGFDPHRYHYDWFQYATAGWAQAESVGFDENLGAPAPFRSRSGDPGLQYALAAHEPMFPLGSVERDDGSDVHDPDDEDVIEVRWTPPATPIVDIVSVTLKTSAGDYAMAETAGVWKATIPAQDQDDVVYWYVHLVAHEGEEDVDYYEPKNPSGGPPAQRTPPDDPHDRLADARYTYVVFEHIAGIYARGYPERITRLGGPHDPTPGLMKTTDPWQFDSYEDIQPYHINAARFLLDSLGDALQHSPHRRGTPEACCWDMPIRWRWSGSNAPWQYRRGGKGGVDDVRPLHSSPAEEAAGSASARRTWRGMPSVYKDDPFDEGWPFNAEFGGNESWLTPYREVFSDDPDPLDAEAGRFWDRGHDAGLRPGDVIDPIHLREIIAAVNYLIDHGAWKTETQNTSRMTSSSMRGRECGHSWAIVQDVEWPYDWVEEDIFYGCRAMCCLSCPPPYGVGDCVPMPTPANVGECDGTKCYLDESRTGRCTNWATDPLTHSPKSIDTDCDSGSGGSLGGASYECGTEEFQGVLDCNWSMAVRGYSYFACGPVSHNNSPGQGVYEPSGDPMWSAVDTDHGNGIRKLRRNNAGGYLNADMLSFGNSYESVTHCRNDFDAPGHVDVGFEQVTPVKFEGLVGMWVGETSCSAGAWMTGLPWSPVPGLGYYATDGSPLCTMYDSSLEDPPPTHRVTGASCSLSENDFPNCKGDNCYVRIDLHLQGGVPRLKPFNMSIVGLDDGGGQTVPTVYPWSECPCSTDPERSDACN